MSGPADEIIRGYIDEVQTYIPLLKEGTAKLRTDPGQKKVLEEQHGMVSTIKGASLMIGIPGLSTIAGQLEELLADMLAGQVTADAAALDAVDSTLECIQQYCDDICGEKGVQSREILRQILLICRPLRNMPPEEDDAVAGILDSVPEHEGLSGQGDEEPLFEIDAEMAEALAESEQADENGVAFPENTGETEEDEDRAMTEMPDVMPELLESFYEESKEHLEELDSSLNSLEARITAPAPISPAVRESIRKIRRAVHTLKGAAAVIGLSNISSWGHIMEDFLDWLFETAKDIRPETVSLLMESADLLARIVAIPQDPQKAKIRTLQARYAEIMQTSPEKITGADTHKESEKKEKPPSAPVEEEADIPADFYSRQGQTLRVSTDRVDELVNLIGELMIAASAFDQQMSIFTEALHELEWSRDRLREIARNMEVEYEVKALGGLKSGLIPPPSDTAAGRDPFSEFEDFDSLELDQYSELSLIIRTLNESSIDVGAIFSRLTSMHSDYDGHFNRQRVLLSDLQDKMMQVRMIPMSTLSNKLRRTVREVAKVLQKKIRLVISGEEIELDRLIWEKITDPLMHLLRNAADHGIEMPEVRKKTGKTPMATIRLEASREGNQVVIRISDDGAGLDYRTIREKALKAGLISEKEKIPEEELAGLIFRPGFSTKNRISEVSGRGVGMDVVRENIQALKGNVRVVSWKDKGTRFTIRIPLTLAAIRALLFSVGGHPYAIALNEIREIIRADAESLIQTPKRALRTEKDLIPLTPLKDYLVPGEAGEHSVENPIILVAECAGKTEALEVDSLLGQQEIVIKSTGTHLRHVRGISGVTIVGDGTVVPILNIPELIGREAGIPGRMGADFEDSTAAGPLNEKPLAVMIVDDSVSIRQVVSRLIEEQGWKVKTAKDGMDALEKLGETKPDIIILDIEMPRMNGYELLSTLGTEPEYRDIPVVMLTSRATGKHQEKALGLGAKGFMVKPYNDNEFIDLLLHLTG
ncbi:MAG: response regulator [Desulfococcaceae bacterium]|jgi:chemosensory pili system protein ChpA (sensor histidine kinase/response regulator)|nr:response regulator [Desulfococcaceae bacterium]